MVVIISLVWLVLRVTGWGDMAYEILRTDK